MIARIRTLAEQLDAHRKRQQAAHSELTLTGIYNVLDALREGRVLTAKERVIHEQGLVSVLRQLHDELDAAVLAAYGWSDLLPLLRLAHGLGDLSAAGERPHPGLPPLIAGEGERQATLPASQDEAKRAFDDAVLERLAALNAERAAEEARGVIRWLRPEFQNPQAASATPAPTQAEIDVGSAGEEADTGTVAAKPDSKPLPWPKDPVEQVRAVAAVLAASAMPLSADDLASRFSSRGSAVAAPGSSACRSCWTCWPLSAGRVNRRTGGSWRSEKPIRLAIGGAQALHFRPQARETGFARHRRRKFPRNRSGRRIACCRHSGESPRSRRATEGAKRSGSKDRGGEKRRLCEHCSQALRTPERKRGPGKGRT